MRGIEHILLVDLLSCVTVSRLVPAARAPATRTTAAAAENDARAQKKAKVVPSAPLCVLRDIQGPIQGDLPGTNFFDMTLRDLIHV